MATTYDWSQRKIMVPEKEEIAAVLTANANTADSLEIFIFRLSMRRLM